MTFENEIYFQSSFFWKDKFFSDTKESSIAAICIGMA